VLLSLVVAVAAPPKALGQVRIERVTVLVRADSAGDEFTPVEELRLTAHRPWQKEFFLGVSLGPPDVGIASLELVATFDIRMGPQFYGGPDGEMFLTLASDSAGVWYRSPTARSIVENCQGPCRRDLTIGPFALLSLIPGPREAQRLLWPTRLRAHVEAFAWVQDPRRVGAELQLDQSRRVVEVRLH
jgi:hypothetical protein